MHRDERKWSNKLDNHALSLNDGEARSCEHSRCILQVWFPGGWEPFQDLWGNVSSSCNFGNPSNRAQTELWSHPEHSANWNSLEAKGWQGCASHQYFLAAEQATYISPGPNPQGASADLSFLAISREKRILEATAPLDLNNSLSTRGFLRLPCILSLTISSTTSIFQST